MGVKAFRDPLLTEDFAAVRLPLDVTRAHDYAVDWTPGRLVFSADGEVVRELHQAPDYPVQLMIGVFDFPARAAGRAPGFVLGLVVSAVRGESGQPSARLM
ncbi:glycoside hydrolase family 16 protein [Blastococcus aurantiacus]|uniref:glycoside hydrolase family 16 protein n=1 Tax=Blastococcus aurantiacus TaxID=1550231 RepID=UPI001C40B965|nr:glycoside hydrolase family 16 protein [Blastococcus aurantiacus]